jgi:hypothetical protein
VLNVVRRAVHGPRPVLVDPERIRKWIVRRVVVEDRRHLPHCVSGNAIEKVRTIFATRPKFSPALV